MMEDAQQGSPQQEQGDVVTKQDLQVVRLHLRPAQEGLRGQGNLPTSKWLWATMPSNSVNQDAHFLPVAAPHVRLLFM